MSTGTFVGTWQDEHGNKLIAGPDGVEVVLADEPPPPPPPNPLGRQLSVYLKMWQRSSGPTVAAAAKPGITEVRLSFLQGSPPNLVGWGCQDEAGVARDCDALRERGVDVTGSIGGSGGAVDTRSRETFLGGIAALHSRIGLDRIDWDVEASALRADDVIAISQACHDRWGIYSTMAPNGSNVGTYLPVAVELHKRGLLAAYGQQFYDAPVSLDAAKGRISQAIGAGVPARLIQVGMMVGGDDRHWDMAECEANLRAIRAKWPDIGGAYLWSEQHGEVAEWARRMSAVLA